jgi:PAS domain S-box-containing protein
MKFPGAQRRFSVATRLIVYIALFSVTLTLIATAIQLYRDYLVQEELLETNLTQVEAGYAAAIADHVWEVADDEVNTLLDGVLAVPSAHYVAIVKDEQVLYQRGTPNVEFPVSRQIPLHYTYKNEKIDLGTLVVTASRSGILGVLFDRFFVILATNAIVIAAVSLFVFVLFQLFVTKNLQRIASFAQALSPETMDRSLELDRPVRPERVDELDILTEAINDMRENLHSGFNALEESEAYWRALIDNAQDIIFLLDGEGAIHYGSPAVTQVLGYSPGSIDGTPAGALVHSDDREMFDAWLRGLNAEAGNSSRLTFRMQHGDGTWRTLEATGQNLLDDPAVAAVVLNARDETERETIEAQLRQAQKMEAVGQLTGGVAHDFNNLLAVIIGNMDILLEELESDPTRQNHALAALNAAERGAELTQRLLAFSRTQTLRPEAVNLNELVHGMADLLRRSLGEDIEIKSVTSGDLWPTEIDSAQMENALLNLAVNARDAMPSGGRLTIKTANKTLTEEYATAEDEVAAGDYAMISVTDTGDGMPPEVVKSAFDPFFTTKDVGKGSGLGLSMIYGFVKQSGGHVEIDSEPGNGTAVKIFLPRSVNAPAFRSTDDREQQPRGRRETIVLVEDEPEVRSLAVTLLDGLGYTVIEAASAGAALAMFEATPQVDMLLTDVVLPGGMSGADLAEEVGRRWPEAKILYMTGYTEVEVQGRLGLDDGVAMLQKPFRKAELAARVRQVLEGATQGAGATSKIQPLRQAL